MFPVPAQGADASPILALPMVLASLVTSEELAMFSGPARLALALPFPITKSILATVLVTGDWRKESGNRKEKNQENIIYYNFP